MKTNRKKRINTEKGKGCNSTENSFLVETSFNSDIDMKIRNDIESKYSKSKMNSEYIFPRVLTHKKSRSKQLSTKNSYDNISKLLPSHKFTKSNIGPILGDTKLIEKNSSKKIKLTLKLSGNLRNDSKKDLQKYRGLSYRQIKTDRHHQSKSPKNSKKYIEIYSKNMPLTCKKVANTEFLNKIFTPFNSNMKLLNTAASMRLRKIYHSTKNNPAT
jgi:hypothetical protein